MARRDSCLRRRATRLAAATRRFEHDWRRRGSTRWSSPRCRTCFYLTNFTGSSAIVVLTAGPLLFITDFRYVAALERTRGTASQCPGLELVRVDTSYDETLAFLLAGVSQGRVGFEAAHLTVARHQWLGSALARGGSGVSLVPTDGLVEHARVRKDPFEIATLREAAARLSAVATRMLDDVQRGRTEREVALGD